jgi:hypothetical protein
MSIGSERVRWRLRALTRAVRGPVVALRHRGLSPSDVILAEYPKSGSTWLTFMLAEILTGIPVGFDNHARVVPAVGRHHGTPPLLEAGGRLLRSHEPYRKGYVNAIYLVRHIGDVAVSYYEWLCWRLGRRIDFSDFLIDLLEGKADSYGSWQAHVESWLKAPIERLVVRYEDLRASPERTVTGILEFLGASWDENQVRHAIENNTITRMREKERATARGLFKDRQEHQSFVRKGRIGEAVDWLGQNDFRLIETQAGHALKQLGYEVQPGPPRLLLDH